jgi:hypothetical protein
MTVHVTGMRRANAIIKGVMRDAEKVRPLLTRIGRSLRDDSKKRISSQDGGTYAPLSKWTRARTGRRKAFITQRKGIGFRVKGPLLSIGHTVIHTDTSDNKQWNFNQHARGFTTPAGTHPVSIKIRNPKALKKPRPEPGGMMILHKYKKQETPARQVFPNPFQAQRIIRRDAEIWLRNIAKRAAR